MPLQPGARIGAYEIASPIGAGGMGEVYRAVDTNLGRHVAIKVLPDTFANDPERLARFEREAKTLAAVSHPNIAHIYGLEKSPVEAGHHVRALAMELVEGPTLADRIAQGPIAVDEALLIAKQIAEALEAAHERGIIHRDLKPANIKVRRDGAVKVLDFGLAKLTGPAEAGHYGRETVDATASPTITSPAMVTGVGMMLGTAAYMSPERARGKAVDKRADIWAFGCVLYEMLTGKRAFAGDDVPDTLASVLRAQPDWGALPQTTPAAIRRLLHRSLQKDASHRLRDIGDAHIEIQEAVGVPADGVAQPVSPGRRQLVWAVGALLVAAVAIFMFGRARDSVSDASTLRFTIAAPPNSTVHSFAISPDGRHVAIAAGVSGKQQLWLRTLDALDIHAMATTDDATYPFWSPDSRYIGFFAQGKLKKIAVDGGPSQSLCDAAGARGGTWSREDVILFSQNSPAGQGLQRVPAAGGSASDVVKAGGVFRYPTFLPDGRHFLYTNILRAESGGLFVGSLDGGEPRRLLADRSAALFAPAVPGSSAGHLLFIRENNLMAMPFDAAGVRAAGDVFPVAEGVSLSLANAGYAPMSVSDTGVLLHWNGVGGSRNHQIVWHDRTGKPLSPAFPNSTPGEMFMPSLSPDERFIAFVRTYGGSIDIWLRDLARTNETRLTIGGRNLAPVWSPRGDRLLYASTGAGAFGALYQKSASGTGDAQLVFSSNSARPDHWSRDGRFIVFTGEQSSSTLQDLWVLPIDDAAPSDRKPFVFVQTPANEFHGQLSPDSEWMAYTSDESGQREVYVRPFPGGDGRWKISTDGGEQPRWRGDGLELFYASPSGQLLAVPIKRVSGSQRVIEPGVPVSLFDSLMPATGTNVGNVFHYDVTSDGKRFAVVTAVPDAPSVPPLTVVVNWAQGFAK